MGSGSEITSSNDDASYAKANRKQRLIDSGTNIRAATKQGSGMEAYCESSSAGLLIGMDYQIETNGIVWEPKIASLFSRPKWGVIYPITTTFSDNAYGIWAGSTVTGTPTIAALDTTDGLAAVYTSGASAGNQAGVNRALLFTARTFNPTFKLRWKTDEAGANIRFFAGFVSQTGLVGNTDDPLNTLHGFGVGMHTGQANYQIMRNDNVGATALTDTGVAKDTSYHTIELWADDNGAQFYWSLDGTVPAALTTEIPSSGANISCQFTVTAVNADAKPLNVQRCIITSDK